MDDIVLQAMRKWPNVPDCYGWLGLDARGHWYLRDLATQEMGTFAVAKGDRVDHDKLRDFMARNYARGADGCWFFQNGPQRVFVELESTPLVWRLQDAQAMPVDQTGQAATAVHRCLMDEAGRVYFATPRGLGLLHSLDVPTVAEALEAGRWAVEDVRAADLPTRYAYVPSPLAAQTATGA